MKSRVRVVVAATALATAACAAPAATVAPTPTVVPLVSPLALYDWEPGELAMQALLVGTLEFRDGCLVVVDDELGDETVVVFPRSLVEWDSATGVLTYGGEEYRAGDRVSMGGGGVETTAGVDMPEACAALEKPWVYYLQDTTLEPQSPPD